MKIFITCIALLCCMSAYSQTVKDTIFFNNGSLVIGKLKKIKLGIVTFDPDDANDIDVQLRKIKSISAGRKIYRIETVADLVHFGTIVCHPVPNKIYIVNNADTVSLDILNISVLHAFDNSLVQRFSGSVNIGFSYTRSSGFGRLNFDTRVDYTSKKGELGLIVSGIYTIYDSLTSRDKEDFSVKYNHYYKKQWFATGFLASQRNLELGLDRRHQQGGGIGNKFITSKYVYAWGRGGLVLNQEKSTDGVSSGVLSEIFGQLEINIFKYAKRKVNISFAQALYYSLSEAGRFRNDGSMNIDWEILKNFYLNLAPYNSYDSKSLSTGNPELDYGVVFGIKYTFY